jgi:hypothetical protein
MLAQKPIILATPEADREDQGLRKAGAKNFLDPISTNKSWVWWCAPVIPATWKA